jgi:hypothetical protein
VVNDAAGDAINTAVLAISSGLAMRSAIQMKHFAHAAASICVVLCGLRS